ncbi:hypothetical protein HJFPF1_02278 [Paramyrothecium foliicola]|nr:hypothetical protein HJFPF1_02278 [Paramyrothecium foliicola]
MSLSPANGGTYHQYLPDLGQDRFQVMQQQNAHEYASSFKEGGSPPWLHALYLHWRELFKEPFKGITNDGLGAGVVRTGLYTLQDEGVPIEKIVEAVNVVTSQLQPQELRTLNYHVDSPEWRSWSNPEFLLSDKGLRLDEVSLEVRDSIMNVLKATLSSEGYEKATAAMRINGFLGELVQAPRVCNEFSYNFVLFGEASAIHPWGFAFYGHHLCLNIFFIKTQMIISPWFTGAEPNLVDQGPHKGTRILEVEERLGLQLMQSLNPEQQNEAQVYKLLKDPQMPHGRWNHDDQRHLCGAYRDNRVVPYEGTKIQNMTTDQRDLVLGILEQYLLYLPAVSRKLRLEQIQKWFDETYFCWIGGFQDDDAFYFRIQSPVVIAEFDHHSGVFLTNKEPAKFHIHTLLRTPNAGDYGIALRELIPGLEQNFMWEG